MFALIDSGCGSVRLCLTTAVFSLSFSCSIFFFSPHSYLIVNSRILVSLQTNGQADGHIPPSFHSHIYRFKIA